MTGQERWEEGRCQRRRKETWEKGWSSLFIINTIWLEDRFTKCISFIFVCTGTEYMRWMVIIHWSLIRFNDQWIQTGITLMLKSMLVIFSPNLILLITRRYIHFFSSNLTLNSNHRSISANSESCKKLTPWLKMVKSMLVNFFCIRFCLLQATLTILMFNRALQSHMTHFCDSFHLFQDIKVSNLWPWKLRSGNEVQHSQWSHLMSNINFY